MEPDKVKKRAARACSFCRSRKVRCIVAGPSEVCTNCKYHRKRCTLDWATGIYPRSPRSVPSTTDSTSHSASSYQVFSTEQEGFGAPDPSGYNPTTTTHTMEVDSASTPATGTNRDGVLPTTAMATGTGVSTSAAPVPASEPSTGAGRAASHPNYSLLRQPSLQSVLPQDLSFLISQGCFIVPQKAALHEFMRQYFLHVHPMLPLLNEADFWRSYNAEGSDIDEGDKLSILVLQGILFASCGFVSLETLGTLGFRSHQESKWAFYRRAKLLYDFGCEDSPIARAQGALLLAQSHLIPRPLAGNTPLGSMWLTIAIHFAREAKAHCYSSTMPADASDLGRARKLRGTLKRLWWCCIICDRVFPLSSRQDIKITKADFDFRGSSALDAEDVADELEGSEVYGPMAKFLLAEVLQKLVELCVVLTDVLTATSVLRNNLSPSASTTDPVACKADLRRWYAVWQGVKASVEGKSVDDGPPGSSATSIHLFTNLVEIYYHSAMQALCHSEILRHSITSSPRLRKQALEESDELQSAISRVTECMVKLNSSQLTRWLPMTAIGCTAFPLALHLIDEELVRKRCDKGRDSSAIAVYAEDRRRHLSVLLDAMNTYRPRYYIADWVVDTVWHIVHLARQYLSTMASHGGSAGRELASWTELLQLVPGYYLRLVMTLEMSISYGKLPEENDFPPTLRRTAQISIMGPLRPGLRGVEGKGEGEGEGGEVVELSEEEAPGVEEPLNSGQDVVQLAGTGEDMGCLPPLNLDISASMNLPGVPTEDDFFNALLTGWGDGAPNANVNTEGLVGGFLGDFTVPPG